MRRIFIDANIYLEFYRVDWREFSKILPSLEDIRGEIVSTKQIEDEVERNKLGITIGACQELMKRIDPSKAGLDASLAAEYKGRFGHDWPFIAEKAQVEAAKRNIRELLGARVAAVARSADAVSGALDKIFSSARDASEDELQRARLRKERGNPPGKRGDPLGDQLTWEQLKASLSHEDDTWIITKDKDYSWNFEGTICLNPLLLSELGVIGLKAEQVHVFDNLSLALTELNKSKPLKTLPDPSVMAEAAREEQFEVSLARFADPGSCGNCGREGTVGLGHWARSQYGGLTWQYICSSCGWRFDTGEPYDD
jgi:hypothetical protein